MNHLDDFDFTQILEKIKKFERDTFTDDEFIILCEKHGIINGMLTDKDEFIASDLLKILNELGIVSYIGHIGPPECEDMFCEFRINDEFR